jgi:hypothetical protein
MAALPAAAQDRPFLFSVSTAHEPAAPALRVDYDLGVGEHEFQGSSANQPEQRLGVYASWRRLTMIGHVGMVSTGSAYQSSQSGEVLVSLIAPMATGVSLAAGGGILHEAGGTDVLLTRLVGGREAATWRLHGNVVLQKPLATGRDAMDVITTAGWARRVTPAFAIGVEGLAEDLEGFWDRQEAEGGARILIGPSIHVAPKGRRWQLTATGGPIFHPSRADLSSDAVRDLPPTTSRLGYAVRVGLTVTLGG